MNIKNSPHTAAAQVESGRDELREGVSVTVKYRKGERARRKDSIAGDR